MVPRFNAGQAYDAVKRINAEHVPGDIVELGVCAYESRRAHALSLAAQRTALTSSDILSCFQGRVANRASWPSRKGDSARSRGVSGSSTRLQACQRQRPTTIAARGGTIVASPTARPSTHRAACATGNGLMRQVQPCLNTAYMPCIYTLQRATVASDSKIHSTLRDAFAAPRGRASHDDPHRHA